MGIRVIDVMRDVIGVLSLRGNATVALISCDFEEDVRDEVVIIERSPSFVSEFLSELMEGERVPFDVIAKRIDMDRDDSGASVSTWGEQWVWVLISLLTSMLSDAISSDVGRDIVRMSRFPVVGIREWGGEVCFRYFTNTWNDGRIARGETWVDPPVDGYDRATKIFHVLYMIMRFIALQYGIEELGEILSEVL